MLCRVPKSATKTLDQVLGNDGDKKDMGSTSPPTGMSPPGLVLNVYTEGPNAWKVICTLTPAVEGTNQAVYLAPGTYPTGLAQHGQFIGSADVDHPEIYAILDATNSDWSRRAEVEHCNDWIRAHDLTLKAAENTIRAATPGLQNRRFGSRLTAYAGALEAFVGHSPHRRIAEVFQKSVFATAERHDFFPQTFKKELTELFLEVGSRTAHRDSERWHHFEYSNLPVPSSELGIMDSLQSSGRDYRRVQRSATFKVDIMTSEQLITLG